MPRKKKRSDKLPPSPWPEEFAPLPDLFVFDPFNRALLEGKSIRGRLWQDGISTLFAGLVMLFFALGFGLLVALPEANLSARIMAEGQTIQARILGRRSVVNTGPRGSTRYFVSYSFTIADGASPQQTYTVEQEVSWSVYEGARRDQIVTVRYLPGDPTQAVLADYDTHGQKAGLYTAVTLAIILVCIFPVWLGSRRVCRARQLARDGVWLCGQVEQIKMLTDKPGSAFTLTYSFHNPEGRKVVWQVGQARGSPKRRPFPPPGAPVAVRYVDEKLFEIM